MRVVLLSKTDRFSAAAVDFAKSLWPALEVAQGKVGDPRPEALRRRGDVLLSFLSPWIVRREELAQFDRALNFHPASADYPGSGCYNFALYEEAKEYGATCHHMLPQVDTGSIVDERCFPVRQSDTVETLKLRTMAEMLPMFSDVCRLIAAGRPLPRARRGWTRKPFRRAEMERLKRLTPRMTARERERRIRATLYPGYPGPYLELPDGRRKPIRMPDRAPIA